VIHWSSYNQSLVRRGEILSSYDFLDIWDDLARMNEKIRMAKGTNFLIPSFLSLVISVYAFTFPIDKQKKDSIKATIGKSIPKDKRPAPSYSQTCRRTNKLDIDINSSI
jgi:hypothetical protein